MDVRLAAISTCLIQAFRATSASLTKIIVRVTMFNRGTDAFVSR